MASSVGFGTVLPAVASSPARRHLEVRPLARPSSSAHVPAATKNVAAAKADQEGKGLFDLIFGPMFKEEQLLETDPILNKVEGKAAGATAKKVVGATAANKASDGSGFSLGGLFSKKA